MSGPFAFAAYTKALFTVIPASASWNLVPSASGAKVAGFQLALE
jgi:hypothetical protein